MPHNDKNPMPSPGTGNAEISLCFLHPANVAVKSMKAVFFANPQNQLPGHQKANKRGLILQLRRVRFTLKQKWQKLKLGRPAYSSPPNIIYRKSSEYADRFYQTRSLACHTFRSLRPFFHPRSILMSNIVQFLHRQINLTDSDLLFGAGFADLSNQ